MDNGHAGCIPFNYLQFRRAVGIPFTNMSGMDVQGASLSTGINMDVQGVSLSTTSSVFVVGVSLSTLPAVWTCKVPLSTTSSVNVQDAIQSIACNVDVRGVNATLFTFVKCFFKCRKAGLSGVQSVRYRNEQKS
jgi:hypothetical protein